MSSARVQTILWWLLFAAYFASKYFVSGAQWYGWGYVLSVVILTTLTALLPWYGSKWLTAQMEGRARTIVMLAAPIMLTVLGFSIFFMNFIEPNFEKIELGQIIYRTYLPGAVMTALLFVPALVEKMRSGNAQAD